MPDGGGRASQVTTKGGTNPLESQDGRYLYYGKESGGASYVWRMTVSATRKSGSFHRWSLMQAWGWVHGTYTSCENPDHQYPGYGTAIYSYELASGFIRKVAEPSPFIVMPSTSPNERRLVFGAHKGEKADLLLVDDLPK